MKKVLTEKEVDNIIQLYKEYVGIRYIAKMLGYHEETIRRKIRSRGLEPRWSKKRRYQEIIKMYVDNLKSTQEIADYFNTTYKNVWLILDKHHIPIRETRGGCEPYDHFKIRGDKHYNWRGGRYIDKKGYVMIINPHRLEEGEPHRVREHRYIMEQHLGRKLKRTDQVHHINGIKSDNRIENLQLVTHTHHYGEIICPHCQHSFLVK